MVEAGRLFPKSHRARQKHQHATGEWLLKDPRFRTWMDTSSCLWLYGKPGSGKTILSSTVVEHLTSVCLDNKMGASAYFYCEQGNPQKKHVSDFLRSILVQFGHQSGERMKTILNLYFKHKQDLSVADDAELPDALISVTSTKNYVYIVLDGLDEIPASSNVAKVVLDLVHHNRGNVHAFVTSRFEKDIKDELCQPDTHRIELLPVVLASDIQHYVEATIGNDKTFAKWPPEIRKRMLNAILAKSNGMFQWVYCQLEELRRCVSPNMVNKTLLKLPKSLNETYERILTRIEEQGYTDLAIRMIQVPFHAYRKIRLAELIDFAAVELGDPTRFDRDNRLADPEDVLRICSGLITFVNESEPWKVGCKYQSQTDYDTALSKGPEVHISHVSVVEYLLSSRCSFSTQLTPHNSDGVLAHCCLLYLLHLCTHADDEPTELLQQYPLATYAARFWFEHLNCIDQDKISEQLMTAALRLLRDDSKASNMWRGVVDLDFDFDVPAIIWTPRLKISPILQLKVWAEETMKKRGEDIRGADYRYQTGSAFYYACLTGNIPIVKTMVEPGLDCRAYQGGSLGYAIAAAFTSNQELYDYLVSQGADPVTCNDKIWELAGMKAYRRARDAPYLWV